MMDLVRPGLIYLWFYYILDQTLLLYWVNTQENVRKITKTICWSKSGGYFNTTYNSKVGILLPGVLWQEVWRITSTCMDHMEKYVYNFFTIILLGGGGGAYKRCTTPIKDTLKINSNSSHDWLKDASFWKTFMGTTWYKHFILDYC